MSEQEFDARAVEFTSEGATLRGQLLLPRGRTGPLAGVVMAHGFSATIPMVLDRFAEVICAGGLAVLLYDHRNLGSSDGQPRGQINLWVQARGFMDAIGFLASQPEVDAERIGLWGDSASAGVALCVTAVDARVKAIVVQCPSTGAASPGPDPDGSRFAAIRELLLHGDVSADPALTLGPMPVVSFDPVREKPALMPLSAYRWFHEYGTRFGTGWANDITRASPRSEQPLSAVLCAPHISAAVQMIVSPQDEMPGSNPAVAREVFEALGSREKEWRDIPGGHFGLLWHPGELFDRASAAQRDFLVAHL
jgi:hypothetical protein